MQIPTQNTSPSVHAIAPIDDKNVFFLNKDGQIGVAKFSPGLSQIGWQYYSEVKWNCLPSLAIGPNYSLVFASPYEVTQAFDTDQDLSLDFFQAIATDWPGKAEGVRITAGPVADPQGRLLFALSPFAEKEGDTPHAKIVAWYPGAEELIPVTNSQLPVVSFALGSAGLLAAQLDMPNYKDGYYLSLTGLPPFDPTAPTPAPESIPYTLPSLLLPAEIVGKTAPTQFAFFHEAESEKLLVSCPDTNRLIEIVPEENKGAWQGTILVRSQLPSPLVTLVEMKPGSVLGGSDNGFVPVDLAPDNYRISRITLRENLIVLDFTRPVDRLLAVKPESYSVTAVSLNGGGETMVAEPTIESDGKTVILKVKDIPAETVLRIVCQNVPSESGDTLLSPAVFSTVHRK